ncbi:MAG: hypothetical protein ACREVC_11990 [Burkholderiales bacterium]
MALDPMTPAAHVSHADALMRRLLGGMSVFTMLMTIPQVVTIWVGHQAAGVSILSWSAYLVSAVLWFWHGLRSGDKNIYLPCVGWVGLDVAVIVGAIIYG